MWHDAVPAEPKPTRQISTKALLIAAAVFIAVVVVGNILETRHEDSKSASRSTTSRVPSPRTTNQERVQLEDILSPTEIAEAKYSAALIADGVQFDGDAERDELILRGRTVCVYLSQPGTTLIRAGVELMDTYGYSRQTASSIATAAVQELCPDRAP